MIGTSTKDTKVHEGLSDLTGLILKDEVYTIMGAAIEVHRELGPGFLEAVYQEAMEAELSERKIPFEAQKPVKIRFKDRILDKTYFADLVCFDQVLVEIKAITKLSGNEHAQIINYLKATGFKVGILINFGSHGKLEWKRFVN